MIRYWIKLLKANDDFIPKKEYLMLKANVDNNRNYNGSSWAFQIKSFFRQHWIKQYLDSQQFEIDIPFNLIKLKMLDIYKQTWYSSLNSSNRLSLYARYKHEFNCENYLDFITEKKCRIALSQFRLSSCDLEIERGRYINFYAGSVMDLC